MRRVRRVRYLLTIHAVPAEAREPGAEHIDAVRRRVRYLLMTHAARCLKRDAKTREVG